jgi:hypothetical protein
MSLELWNVGLFLYLVRPNNKHHAKMDTQCHEKVSQLLLLSVYVLMLRNTIILGPSPRNLDWIGDNKL